MTKIITKKEIEAILKKMEEKEATAIEIEIYAYEDYYIGAYAEAEISLIDDDEKWIETIASWKD